MSGNVAIIIPSAGDGFYAFEAVALTLKAEIYPKAAIVYAETKRRGGALQTSYATRSGRFDWSKAHHLARVLTISHAGLDGPIFGQESGPSGPTSLQPWGIGDYSGKLSKEGEAFWKTVGTNMKADGKILLLGCQIGAASFGKNVSRTAGGKRVYTSRTTFGAGDTRVVIPAIRKIEGKR